MAELNTGDLNQIADDPEVDELNKGLGLDTPKEVDEIKHDSEHDDDDDGDSTTKVDTELDDAETSDERKAIQERRRQERKDKRLRAREKQQTLERQIDSLARQNRELADRVARLDNSNTGAQLAQLDGAIAEADQAAEHFKSVIADSTAKGDGTTVAEATDYMYQARERARELKAYKAQSTRVQPKALDPTMVDHAKKFMTENSWYGGPRSTDQDSKVLSSIDNSLAAEGWDPTQETYWQELRARASKYLPHRLATKSQGSGDKPTYNGGDGRAKSPVAGSGGEGGSNKGGGSSYALSAERVKAIKDAGAWDDPKRRESMIKRYKQYDTNSSNS